MQEIQSSPESDEITLKELILLLKSYFSLLLKKWYWIALSVVVCCSLGLAKYYFMDKIEYNASMTILLNTNSNSSMLSGMMGGLGLGALGGGLADATELDKVKVVIKSQEVFSKVLLQSTTLPAKNAILANYILDSLGVKEGWAGSKEPLLREFKAFEHYNSDSCTAAEWRALIELRLLFTEGLLEFNTTDEGMLEIKFKGDKQAMMCEVLNNMYEEVNAYYIKKQLGAESNTFRTLLAKRDSVSQALAAKQASIAHYNDHNTGRMFLTDELPIQQMQQDVLLLSTMKATLMQNFEVAKMSLQNKQPYLSALNLPKPPLIATFPSRMKNLKTAFLIGFILSVFIIIANKVFRDVMA